MTHALATTDEAYESVHYDMSVVMRRDVTGVCVAAGDGRVQKHPLFVA